MNKKTEYYEIIEVATGELIAECISYSNTLQIAKLLRNTNDKTYHVEWQGRVRCVVHARVTYDETE